MCHRYQQLLPEASKWPARPEAYYQSFPLPSSLFGIPVHSDADSVIFFTSTVAIVIAPTAKNQRIGIFRLTDPPGLSIITNCRQGNDFHPHYEAGPLYVNASGGKEGHVLFMSPERLKARVIDLR